MENKTILIISPEPWGTNFVSKHHYANYLAKNNTVYFLNPPTGFTKRPWTGTDMTKTVKKNGMIVLDYLNLLPKLNNLPKWIQRNIYKKQAKSLQSQIGIKSFDIIWSFDPNRFFDQSIWSADQTIYHTVDFHPTAKFEKDIVLSSDHFLGVAELILAEHSSYRQGQLIPHAADIDGFLHPKAVKLPGNNAIKAIYTGNFHKNINYGLLKKLAEGNPICDFIMIGPTKGSNLSPTNVIEDNLLSELQELKNLFFTGSVPSSELINYLNKGDINLVLFKKENEVLHCSPHKLMAYFYSGNITLSNTIDAHKNTNSEIIKMVDSDDELLRSFEDICQNLPKYNSQELKTVRLNYAQVNSYENRIKEIATLIYQ